MEEIWKDIENYEGLYQISNLGRIKSLKCGKEKLKKPSNNGRGYLQVCLRKNCERKNFMVHRLVAQAFLSNPNNLPQVNHKDENPHNNCVYNLEWCDNQYNIDYSQAKQVFQYDLQGELIKVWKSTMECNRNGYKQSNVAACCRGKRKTCGGYIWSYEKRE